MTLLDERAEWWGQPYRLEMPWRERREESLNRKTTYGTRNNTVRSIFLLIKMAFNLAIRNLCELPELPTEHVHTQIIRHPAHQIPHPAAPPSEHDPEARRTQKERTAALEISFQSSGRILPSLFT